MKLILLRHGKAEPLIDDAHDFARALEPAGRRRVWATAQALARIGVAPDIALVSPAARTRQTWEAAAQILGGSARHLEALYHAAPEAVMACVGEAAKPDITLIVVGHNPGLHQLAMTLAEAGAAPREVMAALHDGFPTASAAVFDWSPETDQPAFLALVVRGRTLTAG